MDDVLGLDDEAFLRAHSRTFLLGRRADGSPTGWPLIGFYPGGALEFSTYSRSQKVRNFERDPGASCVVAPSDSDRALVLRGTVTVRADQRGPSTGDQPPPDAKSEVDATGQAGTEQGLKNSKRVILRFAPNDARFVPGFAPGHDQDGN